MMRRFIFVVLENILHILALLLLCALMIGASTLVSYAKGTGPEVRIEASPSPASPTSPASAASASAWGVYPSPNVGVQNNLAAVAALSAQDAWAVGSDMQLGRRGVQEYYPLIEHWNGKAWSVVPGGLPGGRQGRLVGVAQITAQDVWAIGNYTNGRMGLFIEHWNGVQWSMVGAPVAGTLAGIAAIASNDIWVVGDTTAGDQGLVEHWNGKKWSQVSTPMPVALTLYPAKSVSLNAVSGLTSNDVWLVGGYGTDNFGLGERSLIEHWDGSKWSIASSQDQGVAGDRVSNWLAGITEIAPNDIWAVGDYTGLHGGRDYTLTEHWDGTQWMMIPNPPGTFLESDYHVFTGVAANATNDVWAVGANRTEHTLIEHWDGARWNLVKSPDPGNFQQLEAVVHIPGTHHFWAVGSESTGIDLSNTLIIQH